MSAPNPRLATSADVMQRSKMGMAVAPASSGGRAQIHQIWTVANVPDLDLAANHNGSSARVLLGLRITESSGADDIAHFGLPALLPRWWPSTRSARGSLSPGHPIQVVRRVRSAGSNSTAKGRVIRPGVPATSVVRVTYRPRLKEHTTIFGVPCSSTRQ